MAFQYTGQFNGYIAKANGQLIAYARNPKRYKLNEYTQLVPTETELFVYYVLHPDDFVRSVAGSASNRAAGKIWEDGAKRPEQSGQRMRHKTANGLCIRYSSDYQIGWRTLQTADYKVLLANTNSAENEEMIDWTFEVIQLLENPSNWAGNTADATSLAGGGLFDQGTPENPILKRTLGALAETITLNTNGMAADYENQSDVGLVCVVSPHAARRLAASPELHAVYSHSQYSEALVGKSAVNPNAIFGLPEYVYGFKFIVENATVVDENPQSPFTSPTHLASTSGNPAPRRFIKNAFSMAVCSRPGGLDGELGAPNYSTVQRYFLKGHGELKTKIIDDPVNERTLGWVDRHCNTQLAAPATGFLVTNILAPE